MKTKHECIIWSMKKNGYTLVKIGLPNFHINLIAICLLSMLFAGILSTNNVTAQDYLIYPKGNINFFTSQDTTTAAKEYNKLATKEEKDAIINSRIQDDWTKTILPNGSTWNWRQSALQLIVNSHDWGKDIYNGNLSLLYNGYDGSERDLEQLYANGGTTKDGGKLGLPIYGVFLYDSKTMPAGYSMNAILSGDTLTNWNAWNIIEPQNGATNVKIGEFRLPKNCETVSIGYSYMYEDNIHKKNLREVRIVEFEIKEGKATLIYNANKDTRLVYNADIDPKKPQIALNKRMHVFETRQEAITAAKTLTLENVAQVYPNPANNYLNIEIHGQAKKIDAKIYSIEGKLINQKTIENNEQLDVTNLKDGIYIIRITVGQQVYNSKFVKS